MARRPALYRSLTAIANRVLSLFGRAEGRYRSLPLAGGWTRFRDFPAPPPGGTFHAQWKAAGLDLINLAGLFIPVVGALLLGQLVAQTCSEVFEGIRDWSSGHQHEALEHLLGVAETLAATAATSEGDKPREAKPLPVATKETAGPADGEVMTTHRMGPLTADRTATRGKEEKGERKGKRASF